MMLKPLSLILLLTAIPTSAAFAEGFCTGLAYTKKVAMPLGKGRVPKFTMTIPESWSIESGRKAGDRWILKDTLTSKPVAKFEWDLGNTDQKMLPVILESKMKVGNLSVEKYTVSTSPEAQNEETRAQVTDGLITGYTFEDSSKLSKLVLMSEDYEKASCLETALEKILASITVK